MRIAFHKLNVFKIRKKTMTSSPNYQDTFPIDSPLDDAVFEDISIRSDLQEKRKSVFQQTARPAPGPDCQFIAESCRSAFLCSTIGSRIGN